MVSHSISTMTDYEYEEADQVEPIISHKGIFKDQLFDHLIKTIEFESEGTHINIHFQWTNRYLRLSAIGDRCSTSWFAQLKGYDLISLKDCRILNIQQNDKQVSMPKSNKQEYDQNYIMEVIYLDQTGVQKETKFAFRNSSNGYCNGYFEMNIIGSD